VDEGELDGLVRWLSADERRNASIVNFLRRNEILGVSRVGGSVHVRGRSDYVWNWFSSENAGELRKLVDRLDASDDRFAAVEEWMMPIVSRGRGLAWSLPMVRYLLPREVELPARDGEVEPLVEDDAVVIYESSKYREHISVDYTRVCIRSGPGVAIREEGRLVAWAATQDDCAMGFLQVLETHQRRGFARRLTVALATELRKRGLLPFAYVAEDNVKSIGLLASLGFVRDRNVAWFQVADEL
jgi:8-oxo-dGTP diphosphatase